MRTLLRTHGRRLRWLPYATGIVSFHLLLLLTLPRLVGALALQTTIYTELLLAVVLFGAAKLAVSRYATRAWMRGYATGHWDGLVDASGEESY